MARAAESEQKIRVFVAEDDAAMRALLCDRLRQRGYEVRALSDGRELLAAIDHTPSSVDAPDLVISDVRMPGVTGLQALEVLRNRFDWHVPFIIITAFGDTETHARAYRSGATALFDKPFDVGALLRQVAVLAIPDATTWRGCGIAD
jgi:CheY-like chemotaxis protein